MKKFIFAALLIANITPFIARASDADDLVYFQQFIAEENRDERDPENVTIESRYLMSDAMATTPMPNGDGLNVYLTILLSKDFTFTLVYKENTFPKDRPGQFWPGACKVITGKWNVAGGRLNLPGLGYLERAQWQGQTAVKATVTEVLATPQAQGFQTPASFGFSNFTLDQASRCLPF